MIWLLKKLFGTAQSRKLKRYSRLVSAINDWDTQYQSLSDEALRQKTVEFRERVKQGVSLEALLPEAYAAVKNTCRRMCGTQVHVSGYNQEWDMIPYDVQLLGAIAMFYGAIAEMHTGEGKTLTASLPLYLYALTGKPVHLTTVNDYLAKRDCQWIGEIFRRLGLTVAHLTNDVPLQNRKEVYACDIVYGTSSEFGFDYLRDNSMAMSQSEQVQRGHYFAVIDEIDSILIDEARTPLIISGPVGENRQMYNALKEGTANLIRAQRDLCNRWATEARRTFDELSLLSEDTPPRKLSKEEVQRREEACKKLWLVGKGVPRNKILKRIKENPDLRALIEQCETYFFADQNQQERLDSLAQLFVVVDERNNEYELTDKGMREWTDSHDNPQDFEMLDLGHEFALVDETSLSDEEKMREKTRLREEDARRKERAHNLRQMLRAHLLMEKDVDYIVHEDKIVIIDENTGRPQPGRRFSDGLHQAIEAKEGVEIQGDTQTYATITLQNYFRLYEKIAGMTGTAMTEANEFKEIYNLEVVEIPTYRSCQRKDLDDEIYMTEREKYQALVKEIKEIHEQGRPILIGTESVEVSEKLSRILRQNKLEHSVLNAKQNANEAEIIAEAGKRSAITLATNMAGRGTDIKLKSDVIALGGLHVIGTTRHSSRRIDRQLRGRSGRLGDPGSSKFFISFEDSLIRLFASPRMMHLLQRFRPPEGEAMSAKILNKSIETAQKRVEQRNYSTRKHTLEYDDVMNRQRQEIYAFRNDLLSSPTPLTIAIELLQAVCDQLIDQHAQSPHLLKQALLEQFPLSFDEAILSNASLNQEIGRRVLAAFEQKLQMQEQWLRLMHPEQALGGTFQEIVRNIMIRRLDRLWIDHLLTIDHLRTDVHMRKVGQKDPLLEFKHESFELFENFSRMLRQEIARDLFRFELMPKLETDVRLQKALARLSQTQTPSLSDDVATPQMNLPERLIPFVKK